MTMRGLWITAIVLGTVATAAADAQQAVVRHVPPAEARPGEPVRLVAVVEDAWREPVLVARYRALGSADPFDEAPFLRSSAGGYIAALPADRVAAPGLEYYIAGITTAGVEVEHFGSASWPHALRVETPSGQRWIAADRARLADRRSVVATRVHWYDFGGTHRDRFARGEIDWTHRLIGKLYQIQLGFGFVQGVTPESDPAGAERVRRARYGYGGVRLRFSDNVWVDGTALLGFAEDGFAAGVASQLILGRDDRTAVMLGVETFEELGSQAWLRLQWDTVPPYLMGVTVATTGWPDAAIPSGSHLTFDVSWWATSQLRVTGAATMAARGNRPPGFGAGLATAYAF